MVQLFFENQSYSITQFYSYRNLIEKERLANVANKKEIVRPDGKVVEAFEFTGKLVDSEEKESITIEELYRTVQNSNVDN